MANGYIEDAYNAFEETYFIFRESCGVFRHRIENYI